MKEGQNKTVASVRATTRFITPISFHIRRFLDLLHSFSSRTGTPGPQRMMRGRVPTVGCFVVDVSLVVDVSPSCLPSFAHKGYSNPVLPAAAKYLFTPLYRRATFPRSPKLNITTSVLPLLGIPAASALHASRPRHRHVDRATTSTPRTPSPGPLLHSHCTDSPHITEHIGLKCRGTLQCGHVHH